MELLKVIGIQKRLPNIKGEHKGGGVKEGLTTPRGFRGVQPPLAQPLPIPPPPSP